MANTAGYWKVPARYERAQNKPVSANKQNSAVNIEITKIAHKTNKAVQCKHFCCNKATNI